jgi:hypothetical protein
VLRQDIAELLRMLGVDYVATRGAVAGDGLQLARTNGQTSLFQFEGSWPDVVFLEGIGAEEVSERLTDLVAGRLAASDLALTYRTLPARRVTNHEWVIEVPEELRARHGTVFMNHPIEYHRNLRAPGLGTLTEAHWAVESASLPAGQVPLGLYEAPFRMMTMTLPDKFSILYSLNHYKLWGGASVFFLCMVLGIVAYYGHWERRMASGDRTASVNPMTSPT